MIVRPNTAQLERFFGDKISVGKAALFGAFLVTLSGLISIEDLSRIFEIVAEPIVVLIGLSLIALAVKETGFFGWAALFVAKKAGGNGKTLFRNIYLLGAITTVLFPNDATILMITPLVILLIDRIKNVNSDYKEYLPFLFSVVFVANAASLIFITSNPINILAGKYFELSFLEYARWMAIPGIASSIACYFVLSIVFKKSIPRSYDLESVQDPNSAINDKGLFYYSIVILVLLFAGYFILSIFGYPYYYAVLAAVVALLFPIALNPNTSAKRVVRDAPWDEIVFAVSMFMVVFALKNVGLTDMFGTQMLDLSGESQLQTSISISFLVAVGTIFMNNWPMIMIGSISIEGLSLSTELRNLLVYSTIIGCDLGPKVIPTASLATLIWMGTIKRMTNFEVSWMDFIRVGIVITPITLLAASLVLWIESIVFT